MLVPALAQLASLEFLDLMFVAPASSLITSLIPRMTLTLTVLLDVAVCDLTECVITYTTLSSGSDCLLAHIARGTVSRMPSRDATLWQRTG